jgi:hypothetical protein
MESAICFFVEYQASTIVINKNSNNIVLTGFVSVSDGLWRGLQIYHGSKSRHNVVVHYFILIP